MDKSRIVMSLMLLVAILASIYYEYHFQAKYMLFFITLPLFIALIVVIASGQAEQYIVSPMRNLSLWLETPGLKVPTFVVQPPEAEPTLAGASITNACPRWKL